MTDSKSIFTFEKKGDQTFVSVEVDFKIKSFFGRLMKSMVRKMLQQQTEDGLIKLKKVSEKYAD
jgi:carbon monoxide dehydrogenase subunit G